MKVNDKMIKKMVLENLVILNIMKIMKGHD